jgi:hypothetical protein
MSINRISLPQPLKRIKPLASASKARVFIFRKALRHSVQPHLMFATIESDHNSGRSRSAGVDDGNILSSLSALVIRSRQPVLVFRTGQKRLRSENSLYPVHAENNRLKSELRAYKQEH